MYIDSKNQGMDNVWGRVQSQKKNNVYHERPYVDGGGGEGVQLVMFHNAGIQKWRFQGISLGIYFCSKNSRQFLHQNQKTQRTSFLDTGLVLHGLL